MAASRCDHGPDGRPGDEVRAVSTVRLTVGQAIVRFLAEQYVERDGEQQRFIAGVWGIFGHGNVAGLGQALEELRRRVRHALLPAAERAGAGPHRPPPTPRHKNRLQAFACTASIGPGSTNMVTGAATATVNRIPVLLFPSDYFANRLVDPVLQQVEHPVERDVSASDAFRPVSRYFDRISRPEQLLSSLPEAFRVLTDPAETGAVTVSLPEDVQAEAFDWPVEFLERRVWRIRRPVPEREVVDRAVELIRQAARPLVVCGGGVIYADADGRARPVRDPVRDPRGREPGRQGRPAVEPPDERRAHRRGRGLAANRLATGRRPRDRDRHPARRLRHRLEDRVPGPRRRVHRDQRRRHGRRQAAGPADGRGRPRGPRRAECRPRGRRLGRHDARPTGSGSPRRRPPGTRRSIAIARARAARATPTGSSPSPRSSASSTTPWAARDGDLRGGQPAGRPSEAVAARGPEGLPPRVRLLVHGLRDRGRARRPARRSATATSWSWSGTART